MARQNPAAAWYAVHTQPRKEMLVSALLEQELGLPVFLPEVTQKSRGRIRLTPLFPGYLFVQVNLAQTTASTINTTPGVIRMVAFGEAPRPLAPAVIDALRAEVDALNAQGGLPQHPYRPGDPVRFRGGPLEGLHAVFLGPLRPAQRVRVLLTFLGQQQEVTVDVDKLERAAGSVPARPPRRTRGKGRPIKPPATPTDRSASR
jgi:transcriptional antiterminator RfaH